MKKLYITDIEGNGLYDTITQFHCAWICDYKTKEWWGFLPHQLEEYCNKLAEADVVIGQNIIDFDCPALAKLNKLLKTKSVFDTIVLSRILEPDRLVGHSLKAWGKALEILKGEYGEEENAWEVFTEAMFEYCKQDVAVTVALFEHLCKLAGFDPEDPPCVEIKWDEFS